MAPSDRNGPDFGAMVRQARTSRGLLQRDVAGRAGVSREAVLDLEAGRGTLATLLPVMCALDLHLAGMPNGDTLYNRIRVARQRRGWSLEKASERIGISKGALVRLERGVGRVTTLEAVLRVLAVKARPRHPETTAWMEGRRDRRFTPTPLFETFVRIFGEFGLDPCADIESPVRADRCFTAEDDGLSQPWRARSAYCNPPYSQSFRFVQKAFAEWRAGHVQLIVMLLPVRTHGTAFHEIIAPYAETFFLRHRVVFTTPEGEVAKSGPSAPFGNAVSVFGATPGMVHGMQRELSCVHLPPSRLALTAEVRAA